MMQILLIGTTELLLIGGLALLIFGGKKLPEIMRGLGQGVKEFKNGMKDDKGDDKGDCPKENPQQSISKSGLESLNSNDKHEKADDQK